MFQFGLFVGDETGAVSIDWVALTAGVLLLGIVVVYAVFNVGVAPVVLEMNSSLGDDFAQIERGVAIDCNTFGSC